MNFPDTRLRQNFEMQYELFRSVLVTSCELEISSQVCKIWGFHGN